VSAIIPVGEGKKSGERAVSRNFEDRSSAVISSLIARSVESPVLAERQPSVRKITVPNVKGQQAGQCAAGSDPEHRAVIKGAAIERGAIEIAIRGLRARREGSGAIIAAAGRGAAGQICNEVQVDGRTARV